MHTSLIMQLFPDWQHTKPSPSLHAINRLLRKVGIRLQISPPISTGTTTSVEQRLNMYHLVSAVLFYDVPGDLVEVGCHAGKSAVLFQSILEHYRASRRILHVYDSFQGLPNPTSQDGETPFHKGQMATSKDALLATFRRLALPAPVIHEGWFTDTLPESLPEQIAFAHLDGDLYESIKVSLQYVYPRLSSGAVCLIDDYTDSTVFDAVDLCPGVKRACDEFLADKPESMSVLYGGFDSILGFGSHAYFRKH